MTMLEVFKQNVLLHSKSLTFMFSEEAINSFRVLLKYKRRKDSAFCTVSVPKDCVPGEEENVCRKLMENARAAARKSIKLQAESKGRRSQFH